MRHLSVVPAQPVDVEPVAFVPVRLLLAASGRCSCDECCRAATHSTTAPARTARNTDRPPVHNLHRLS
jgi:hypothetical protein